MCLCENEVEQTGEVSMKKNQREGELRMHASVYGSQSARQ